MCFFTIGNEPQKTLFFSFFDSMHCAPVQRIGSVTLCHSLYFQSVLVFQINELFDKNFSNFGKMLQFFKIYFVILGWLTKSMILFQPIM